MVYPLAIIHVLGNVLTNVSLGKVAVSFTHTVKVSGRGVNTMLHHLKGITCSVLGLSASGICVSGAGDSIPKWGFVLAGCALCRPVSSG